MLTPTQEPQDGSAPVDSALSLPFTPLDRIRWAPFHPALAIGFALVRPAPAPAAFAAAHPDPWFEPAFARPRRPAATFTVTNPADSGPDRPL